MRRILAAFFIMGCGAGSADTGGTTPSGGTDPSGTDTDTDTTGSPACRSWLADYDLTGSVFHIESTQDFDIVVQEPYDDDLNTGPGHVVLRLPDVDGAMAAGPAAFVEYQLTWDFVTGVSGIASVHTAIENQAGPEACGLTTGTIAGTSLDWAPPTINVCQNGEISCTGAICGQFGSPPADQPEVITDDCADWEIHPFTFSADLSTFDMNPAIVSDADGTTTAMEFHATLKEAHLDPNPPDCACAGG